MSISMAVDGRRAGFRVRGLLCAVLGVFSAMMLSGCGDNGNPGNGGGGGGGGGKSVWLLSNVKLYTVTDGVVGSVSTEINQTWTSYTDDKHYELSTNITAPFNTHSEYDTYTSSTVGFLIQSSSSGSRNGNTLQQVTHSTSDYTQTVVYKDPAREDYIRRTTSDITQTSTIVYDEGSGLTLRSSYSQTGTTNGEPVNSSGETNYTIVPLSTQGDIKTYKSTTGGTGAYTEYKIQNGVTLETKSYTAEGTLSYIMTSTFTDNATIRAKLSNFTVSSVIYEATPASNSYQTCEVVYDSATELKIRIKTYNSGTLTGQQENTYNKR